MVNGEL